jgi:hypothetical protein
MVKVHPIYKELRDTHRQILSAWRDIGLRGQPVYGGEELAKEKDLKKGDSTLYSRMMKSSQGGRR